MPSDQPSRKNRHSRSRHTPGPGRTFGQVLERHAGKIALALTLAATIRIASTYPVFSHTSDEPAHLACGMEWLDRGAYRIEAQHPPLARIAAALGPFLLGSRIPGGANLGMYQQGLEIYYGTRGYDLTLTASRVGVLPFFWLAAFVVFAWAKRDFGVKVALAALFLFTTLPPVLAHAGLATTDMALTACLGAAFLSGRLCLERPGIASAAVFGVCGALAVLSKFSSLLFFPPAAALALAAYAFAARLPWNKLARASLERIPSIGVALGVALVVIWAGYRFSFGKVDFAPISLPAPEFFRGLGEVIRHNSKGHLSYLSGKLSRSGFIDYYAVALAVKTPLAFLALTGVGAPVLKRGWKANAAWTLPAAYAIAIVLVGLLSRINIGVRHILPVYTGLSIVAAAGALHLAEAARARKWTGAVLGALLAWQTLSSLGSHPDYLPYFNELAGAHPENVLVDSDLDWGQDIKRLEQRLRTVGADSLALAITGHVSERGGLPPLRDLNKQSPLTGCNAIGLTAWKQFRLGYEDARRDLILWPDRLPPHEMVGKSIALWCFPPSMGLPD